jgi:thioredoxin-related protein
MKKLSFVLGMAVSAWALGAPGVSGEGVDFFSGSFDQALQRARTEGKWVFLDCVTDWCAPCKSMERRVFPIKEVGEYFNQKFVSLRVDIEKGEGIVLAQRFHVQPVPAFVFVNPEGEVEHKFTGGETAEVFLAKSRDAFSKEDRYGVLQRRYRGGDRSPEFLDQYLGGLLEEFEYRNIQNVLRSMLTAGQKKTLCRPGMWRLFTNPFICERDSEFFQFVVRNASLWRASLGEMEFGSGLKTLLRTHAIGLIFSEALPPDPALVSRWKQEARSLNLEDSKSLLIFWELAERRANRDLSGFVSILERELPALGDQESFELLMSCGFFAREGNVELRARFKEAARVSAQRIQDERQKNALQRTLERIP